MSASRNLSDVEYFGDFDYYLIKLGPDGKIIWEKKIGGNKYDPIKFFKQTADNGFLLAGVSWSTDIRNNSYSGGFDIYIVKLNSSGGVEWEKMLGGSQDETVYVFEELKDGNFIIAGSSFSTDFPGLTNDGSEDSYIIKFDLDGNIIWQKMYGGSGNEGDIKLFERDNGDLILIRNSTSIDIDNLTNNGFYDILVTYLNNKGNIIWENMYGGNEGDFVVGIEEVENGNFIISGVSHSVNIKGQKNNGARDLYLLKIDSLGKLIWEKLYGGNQDDEFCYFSKTVDKGFIVGGYSDSSDIVNNNLSGGFDFYVLKMNENCEFNY
jgi:phenylpyruvate tautomerase PptA (4-oxalocrotonate tautomerase family)